MTFPLAKLGFLLMKQLSRPLANVIKNGAKNHPFFRKYFCQSSARAYSWMESRSWMGKRQKDGQGVQMTEEEEVELGANLLGEVILFSILSVILYFEINRQGDIKANKEKMKADEIQNMVDTISDIIEEVNDLKRSLKKLEKKMESPDDLSFLDVYGFLEDPKYRSSDVHFRDYMNYAFRKLKHSNYDPYDRIDGDPYSP